VQSLGGRRVEVRLRGDKPRVLGARFVERDLDLVDREAPTQGGVDAFVDWGYQVGSQADPAVQLHVAAGCRDWLRWVQALDREGAGADLLTSWLDARIRPPDAFGGSAVSSQQSDTTPPPWLPGAQMITPEAAVATIEAHPRRGFPINPDGARLRSPNDVDPGVLPPTS